MSEQERQEKQSLLDSMRSQALRRAASGGATAQRLDQLAADWMDLEGQTGGLLAAREVADLRRDINIIAADLLAALQVLGGLQAR